MHHCIQLDLWWNRGNYFRWSTYNVCSRRTLVWTVGSRHPFALPGNSMTWIVFLCSTNRCHFGLCSVKTVRSHCLCPAIRFAVRLVLVRHRQPRPHPIPCATIPFWSRTNGANSSRWNTIDWFRPIFAPTQHTAHHCDCIRQPRHSAIRCDGYDFPYNRAPKSHVYQHRQCIWK